MANTNELVSLIIHFLSFLPQPFLTNYFYTRYLTPKNKKRCTFYVFISYFIYLIFIIFVYEQFLLRFIGYLITIQIISICFYKDNIGKRISAGLLVTFFNSMADIISQYIIIFFLGSDTFIHLSYPLLCYILIQANIIIFIFIKIFLHFFQTNISYSNKYSKLFTALNIFLCLLTNALLYSFVFNDFIKLHDFKTTFIQIFFILAIYLFGFIFCSIYIYKSIIDLKDSITKELLMQYMHQQYLTQLAKYIDARDNDEQIKHLRHDIMNYVQTIHTIKENQDEN